MQTLPHPPRKFQGSLLLSCCESRVKTAVWIFRALSGRFWGTRQNKTGDWDADRAQLLGWLRSCLHFAHSATKRSDKNIRFAGCRKPPLLAVDLQEQHRLLPHPLERPEPQLPFSHIIPYSMK